MGWSVAEEFVDEGMGINRVAREVGCGSSTVQRVKASA